MKIKDTAHAVRVLEALEKTNLAAANSFVEPPEVRPFVVALIDGAKAVLEEVAKAAHGYRINTDSQMETATQEGREDMADIMAIRLAQAYAPRMAEAGMEVPE